MPQGAEGWPLSFRRYGFLLASESDRMTKEQIQLGQLYMTSTLIERRQLQLPLDIEARRARGRPARGKRVEVVSDSDGDNGAQEEHPEVCFRGQAGSSTDRLAEVEEVCLPGCAGSSTSRLVQSVDAREAAGREFPPSRLPEAASAGGGGAKRKGRRRAVWDLDTLPGHIVKSSDGFTSHFFCLRCGCRASPQARSPFFKKHFNCDASSKHRIASRANVRKRLAADMAELRPTSTEVLSWQWYINTGTLPMNMSQVLQNGPIECVTCGSSAVSGNRKRFVKIHIKCLETCLCWLPNGDYAMQIEGEEVGQHEPDANTFVQSDVTRERRSSKCRRTL
eukprot:1310945-Amphidinium_carterae.2